MHRVERGSRTFVFTITAPTTPGYYNFQWRMVHEFVNWFGDYSPTVTIQVLSAPPPAQIDDADFVIQSVPTILAFLFNIHATPDSLAAAYDEVLTAPGRLCLGSGAPAAEALYASNRSLSQFHVLKHVIDDPAVPRVGGPIQCGQFVGPDFVIRGIEDFTVDQDSKPPSITIQYFVAGMPVYKAPLEGGWDAFPYRQAFLLTQQTPDHSTLSRWRRKLPVSIH